VVDAVFSSCVVPSDKAPMVRPLIPDAARDAATAAKARAVLENTTVRRNTTAD
jgi:hypothetical protein